MKENKTIAVLGLGLFGLSVAKTLAKNGTEVIAMDHDMDKVQEISHYVDNAIQGDFTKVENLEGALIDKSDIVVIATGEQLEVTITTIFHLKKMGVPHIIVKTKSEMYKEVLLMTGADRVLLPEVDSGISLGVELSHVRMKELLMLDDNHHIVEITVFKNWVGKTLRDLNLSKTLNVNVLGIKRNDNYTFLVNPDVSFEHNDKVLLLSGNKKINSAAQEVGDIYD